MSSFEPVRRFMVFADQDVTGEDKSLPNLYTKLIVEEYAEFMTAYINKDEIEQLDAVCDMIVVLAGYAYAKGWNIQGAFDEVTRSNMSKVDIESGKLLKRDDGKVMKPATYSAPELEPFMRLVDSGFQSVPLLFMGTADVI